MATTTTGFPKWLLDCKDNLTSSKEWEGFLSELHDAIQQQLTESHVQYFTDLTEAEKDLFMERATRAIQGGSVSSTLYKKIALLMDQQLNEEVSRMLMEDIPLDSKSDLIIDTAQDGAVSLLKKWPEMKSKLKICFNQPIPQPLRQIAWRLFLSNTNIRKQYVDILSVQPRTAISPQDYEISRKCEELLNSEPTFSNLQGSVGAFYGMKAVLSYHHALSRSQMRLKDIDYMLIVPMVEVSSTNLSRKDPAAGRVVALLVEEYLTFMDMRPGYVVDSGSEIHDEELKAFVRKVSRHVESRNPSIARAIGDHFAPSRERIVATEVSNQAVLIDGLSQLVRPLIRSMFVGYLRMDTLLYVWDQYMIGLDTPGYHDELLPVVTATFLSLLQEPLTNCSSPSSMESVLKQQGPALTIPQFQYEIKQHHHSNLYGMLEQDQKAAMPVLDPTQSTYPPWHHWFNDRIPPYMRPQDRRRAREEREAERERLLQQKRDADQQNRGVKDREKKDEEDEYYRQAELDRRRAEEDRMQLEDMVDKERRKRLNGEKQAQNEIERLQNEIDALKRRPKSPAPSLYSMSSGISRILIPPPPTAVTHVSRLPPVSEMRTPTPRKTPKEQKRDILLDFLRKVAFSVKKIGHSEGSERDELDRQTRIYMSQNNKDLKQAQRDLFGHILEPGDFDRMSPEEQKNISDKMMDLMTEYRQKRKDEEDRQRQGQSQP